MGEGYTRAMERPSYSRIVELLAWDGCLPLVVASVPLTLRAVFPQQGWTPIFALILPMVAAMARASIGRKQVERVCGRVPISRELSLAGAIIALFLFELLVGAFATVPVPVPLIAWVFPLGFFAGYLLLIYVTLREPRARVSRERSEV